MRIAIVGSGISGLGAAWLLEREHEVTVFADARVQAFISSSPINRYHVLVGPKFHYEHLAEVPQETLASVMRMAQRASPSAT